MRGPLAASTGARTQGGCASRYGTLVRLAPESNIKIIMRIIIIIFFATSRKRFRTFYSCYFLLFFLEMWRMSQNGWDVSHQLGMYCNVFTPLGVTLLKGMYRIMYSPPLA